MYQHKKSHNMRRIFIILLVAIVGITFCLLLLEKYNITNIYSKNESTSPNKEATRQVNDIDYSPASPTDNDEINQKKESGSIQPQPSSPTSSTPISVSLTAAGQDDPKGPLIVRTLVNDATYGTCVLTITKGAVVKTYTEQVQATGTYYRCAGFDIPATELESGTWQVKILVASGDRSGSAERAVDISI